MHVGDLVSSTVQMYLIKWRFADSLTRWTWYQPLLNNGVVHQIRMSADTGLCLDVMHYP